jgi:hypothetical protein
MDHPVIFMAPAQKSFVPHFAACSTPNVLLVDPIHALPLKVGISVAISALNRA